MWGKIEARLIDGWRSWYKRWSSWLAYIWGLIGVAFWVDPSWMGALVAAIPGDVRMTTSPVIWIVLAGLPIIITQIKQKKLQDQKDKPGGC